MKKLREFGGKHPEIGLIYLFGSRARGREIAGSDLDVAILSDENAPVRDKPGCILELSRTLSVDDVDMIDLSRAPLQLAFQIIKNGRCVFERRKGCRVPYEARILGEYLDAAVLFETHRRFIKEQIRKGEYFG